MRPTFPLYRIGAPVADAVQRLSCVQEAGVKNMAQPFSTLALLPGLMVPKKESLPSVDLSN
jgi:hypothetical protein